MNGQMGDKAITGKYQQWGPDDGSIGAHYMFENFYDRSFDENFYNNVKILEK